MNGYREVAVVVPSSVCQAFTSLSLRYVCSGTVDSSVQLVPGTFSIHPVSERTRELTRQNGRDERGLSFAEVEHAMDDDRSTYMRSNLSSLIKY